MIRPPSPCNRVCRIDAATGWCLGCYRSMAEIADWPMLSAGQQRALLAKLAERGRGKPLSPAANEKTG